MVCNDNDERSRAILFFFKITCKLLQTGWFYAQRCSISMEGLKMELFDVARMEKI